MIHAITVSLEETLAPADQVQRALCAPEPGGWLALDPGSVPMAPTNGSVTVLDLARL